MQETIVKWVTSTIIGMVVLGVIINKLSDVVPNPFGWVVKKLRFNKKNNKNLITLLLADRKTPLHGARVRAASPDRSGNKDGFEFLSYLQNKSDHDTGTMEFRYYLDGSWPRPEATRDSDVPGYPYCVVGVITWRENHAAPGSQFELPLGLRFGTKYTSLPAGDHQVFLQIKNPEGQSLYEGRFTVEIPNG